MAVRRAASPSRSPSAGDRRKRSRSAASDKTVTVARRRRETRRSSSEESQRELRRVAAAKARDASPAATDGAAGSPRARRSRSLGERRDEGQRDDNKSRSSGRGRKDERHEEHTAPHRRESSDKDLEQVQCKQCGSYCRGQAGLKMHQAYSKKCLAYGYWNKGIKPWDKCLTMANKMWQVRERKDKQSRGPQAPQRDDRRPSGNQNDRARQHDDESRQPREREKPKVSVPREGGRASLSREDRRGRERSRRGRSERRRSRASERSAKTFTLTEAKTKKNDEEPESSRRQPPRRREKPESGQDDVKHVKTTKTSKPAEVAKQKDAEKTKPATKTKVVPVNESEDEVEEESSSSSYSYYTTEASPQLSGPAAPKAKAGLQPTSKAKATSTVSAQVALKAAKAKPKAAPAAASSSSAGPHTPGDDVSLVNSVLSSQAEMMRWWMQQHRQAGQE